MINRPKESDIDLEAPLVNWILPLCHSDSLNGNSVSVPQDGMVRHMDVSTDNGQAMRLAVVQQPESIAIEGDQSSFQFYSSGTHSGISLNKYRRRTALLRKREHPQCLTFAWTDSRP